MRLYSTMVVVVVVLATVVCGRETTTGTGTGWRTENVESTGTKNAFIAQVLQDHTAVRSLVSRFRGDERGEDTARTIIGALLRHDRRERMTLYPLVAVLLPDAETAQMVNEHNTMLLALQRLHGSNLHNTTTLDELDTIINDVFKHLKEEETDVLPVVGQFLSTRPKLTAALLLKWNSITSTQPPLVTELVDSEHVTVRVLTSALRLYARAARAQPDDTDLAARRDKVARSLVKSLHEHSLCETAVFYPLVNKVLGSAATARLMIDHNMLDEMVAKLKTSTTMDLSYAVTLTKAIRLEMKHIAAERVLMNKLNPYLEENVDENQDLVTAYVKCEMIHHI